MSSESESEMSTNEARVYTTKTSPKRVAGVSRSDVGVVRVN